MSQMKDDLLAIRAQVEKGWHQGWWAGNADGHDLDADDIRATCWCIRGAAHVALAHRDEEREAVEKLIQAQVPNFDPVKGKRDLEQLVSYNDAEGRTKEDMLKLIDMAIMVVDCLNNMPKADRADGEHAQEA